MFHDLKVAIAETEEQALREAKRARKKVVFADASWVYEGKAPPTLRRVPGSSR